MHQPPRSYFSPKVKIGRSKIEGQGLIARKDIKKDELIGIKDGYIIDRKAFSKIGWKNKIGQALLQIDDYFFLGPRQVNEIKLSMMYVNHSCDANVGILRDCISVAMRNIEKGEELTSNYALWLSDKSFRLVCRCGAKSCRDIITGNDWKVSQIQRKYKGYFSAYIQKKIDRK